MKDFLGRELAVGDEVVVTVPNYRSLVRAKIVKFTPKMIRVNWRIKNQPEWMEDYTYLACPDFVVKVTE